MANCTACGAEYNPIDGCMLCEGLGLSFQSSFADPDFCVNCDCHKTSHGENMRCATAEARYSASESIQEVA